VAILTGLKEGDTVVTSGQIKLKNGSAVIINNQIQPSNDEAPQPEDQ
jgi:membrane fusion protein (multidrug efflux system)